MQGIVELTPTVRILQLSCDPEEPCAINMDMYNVPFDKYDTLSSNLLAISMDLRELHLDNVRISKEFFWPLQDSEARNFYWPKLKVLEIDSSI